MLGWTARRIWFVFASRIMSVHCGGVPWVSRCRYILVIQGIRAVNMHLLGVARTLLITRYYWFYFNSEVRQ